MRWPIPRPAAQPPSANPVHNGRQGQRGGLWTGAVAAILGAATNGMAADFSAPSDAQRVGIVTAGVLAYQSGVDALFDNSQEMSTPVRVRNSLGQWVWSPHNLYPNSAAPGTAVIGAPQIIQGCTYTIAVTGTKSLNLSDAISPAITLTAANSPYTFTAATGTLRCTSASGTGTAQLNRGTTLGTYLATAAGAAKYAVPVSYEKNGAGPFLVIEQTANQKLDNTDTPATQTKSLAAGTYTLWCEKCTVTLSGGPTGAATEDSPVTFTLGSTTSVTFTVSNVLSGAIFNCTDTAVQTSYIQTFTAPAQRTRPVIAASLAGVPALGSSYSWFVRFSFTGTPDNCYAAGLSSSSTDYSAIRIDGGANLIWRVRAAGVSTSSQHQVGVAASTIHTITVANRPASTRVSNTGSPFGGAGSNFSIATMPAPTSFNLGKIPGDGSNAGVIKVYQLGLLCEDLASKDVSTRFYNVPTDPTPYDIMEASGQSNQYFGIGLDVAVDVSGGSVFQLNASTGAFSAANEPLQGPNPATGGAGGYIGHMVAFARDHYVPATGKQVLILQDAVSATAHADNRWNPGNDLYERRENMVGLALARFPKARLRLLHWQGSEQDAVAGWTQAQEATALDANLSGFRAKFGNVPIIVGAMVPAYAASHAAYGVVQLALADTPNRLTNCAYAYPGAGVGGAGNEIHYTAAEHRGAVATAVTTAATSLGLM